MASLGGSIDQLPLELKFAISSYLDTEGLYNLACVSKSWTDVAQNPPKTTTNEIRKRLLKLYIRYRASVIWPIIQKEEIVSRYCSETAAKFDRETYLARFENSNIGEEFCQWVLNWPHFAPIGFLGPDLPANEQSATSNLVYKPEWWMNSLTNGLAPSCAWPEKIYIAVSKNHALRRMSKEERKSKGWGGFSKESKDMIVKVLQVAEQLGQSYCQTYIYVDGMAGFNGCVWTDEIRNYRWNDELDAEGDLEMAGDNSNHSSDDDDYNYYKEWESTKQSAFPEIKTTGWIEWLEGELGTLEKRYQAEIEREEEEKEGKE